MFGINFGLWRELIKQTGLQRKLITTRRALGREHSPPTKLFRRLAANKTIVKPRVAAVVRRKTILQSRIAAAQYP